MKIIQTDINLQALDVERQRGFFGIISTIRRTGDEGLKDITDMEKDRQYMKMALELAQKGMGFTAPNPMVGAVMYRTARRCLHICYSGTLLPLRETASVCQCNPGIGDQTCYHWFLGP